MLIQKCLKYTRFVVLMVSPWTALSVHASPPVISHGGTSGGGGDLIEEQIQYVGSSLRDRMGEMEHCLREAREEQVPPFLIPSSEDLRARLVSTLSTLSFDPHSEDILCEITAGLKLPRMACARSAFEGQPPTISWNENRFPAELRVQREMITHELLRASGYGYLENYVSGTAHYRVSMCMTEVLGSIPRTQGQTPVPSDARIARGNEDLSHVGANSAVSGLEIPANSLSADLGTRSWIEERGSYQHAGELRTPIFSANSFNFGETTCIAYAREASTYTRVIPAETALRVTGARVNLQDHWGMLLFDESPTVSALICTLGVRTKCSRTPERAEDNCAGTSPSDRIGAMSAYEEIGAITPTIQDMYDVLRRQHVGFQLAEPSSVR